MKTTQITQTKIVTCGNLFDLENAFCSKNLISRALSHKACKEKSMEKLLNQAK